MSYKAGLLISAGILVFTGCQPIEYAEELTRNQVNLKFHTTVENTPLLTMHLVTEPDPVISQPLSSYSLEDFRGPPGWYFAEISGDIDSDADIESLKAVFNYEQSSTTEAHFGALGSFSYALTQCQLENYQIGEAIEVISRSFGIHPGLQDTDEDLLAKYHAIEVGIGGFAESLDATYASFITVAAKDIASDCLLNGYLVDPSTGTRERVDYFGSTLTAQSMSVGISYQVTEYGNSNGVDIIEITDRITTSSSELFDDKVESFDTEAVEIDPEFDLGVSLFGDISLVFSYEDNVGLKSATANIDNNFNFDVEYDFLNKTFTLSGDVSELSSSTKTLEVSTIDLSNNTATESYDVIIDNTGPSASLDYSYYNEATSTLNLTVLAPTGSVTSVAVAGEDFVNTENNSWTGAVSLEVGSNALSVIIETDFGLTVERTLTAYLDVNDPTISFDSNLISVSDSDGSNPTSKNVHTLTMSDFVDLNRTKHYLLGHGITESELDDANIPYLKLTLDDQNNVESTDSEDLKVSYSLAIDGAESLTVTDYCKGNCVLPLVHETLGSDYSRVADDSAVELNITVLDMAGNSTKYTFNFNIETVSYDHSLKVADSLSGTVTPIVWKGGTYTALDQISAANFHTANVILNSQYEHIQLEFSHATYTDDQGLDVYTSYENTVSEVITLGSANRTVPAMLGSSIYGAFTSAGYYQGDTANDSYADGDSAFKTAFPGALFSIPVTLASITEYNEAAAAAIFNEAIIRGAIEVESKTGNQCSAFDLDKLAAQDFKDDMLANNSINPVTDVCQGYSPYNAVSLIAKHEREITHELGLLEEGNDFDLNIARPHYTPTPSTLRESLDVGTYSGLVSFTPVYRSDSDSYNVRVYLNNVFQGNYAQGDEISFDSTQYPNGIYVIRLETTDLYYNTNTTSLFTTFQN